MSDTLLGFWKIEVKWDEDDPGCEDISVCVTTRITDCELCFP